MIAAFLHCPPSSRPLRRALAVLACGLAALQAQAQSPGGAPAEAGRPAAGPRFAVLEYVVEGNSVLPAAAIETAVYPFLGPDRGIEDVDAARQALERAYQKAGFVTVSVDIPEQQVDAGAVRLRVLEGRIGRTVTRGARYHASSEIRAMLPGAEEGAVLNAQALQQQLAQVNRSADLEVRPALKPGRTPGTVDLELEAEDKLPLHGSASLSNWSTYNTTRPRLSGDVRYDNFLGRSHSLGLSYLTTPEDTGELRVISASYIWPLADRRAALLYAVDSDSTSLAAAGTLLVAGKLQVAGVRYLMPLDLKAGWRATASFGLDYKRNEMNLDDPGAAVPRLGYLPFTLGLNAARSTPGSLWRLDGSLVANFRGLGSDDEDFAARRVLGSNPAVGASASFAYLRLDLAHEAALGRWRWKGRFGAHLADRPLINLEQMALGGAESSRAYYEAEALGDRGWRAGAELSTPALAIAGDALRLNALAFVEGGFVYAIDPLIGQPERSKLVSAGMGLRLQGRQGLSLGMDLARALSAGPITARGSHRLTARLLYEF